MTPATFVGNDVVDLEEPRTRGKATDTRFVARVLDGAEAAGLRSAPDADLELWSLWASKEAAFKTVSKLRGSPPPFAHASFRVRWDRSARQGAARVGLVCYEEIEIPVRVLVGRGVLHALAHAAPLSLRGEVQSGLALLDEPSAFWRGRLDELLPRFTPREAEAVHSRASAAVRLGARAALAAAMHVGEDHLEIVCSPGPPGRRPPVVLLDGSPTAADVSLSHHGRWIAWALHVDPELSR